MSQGDRRNELAERLAVMVRGPDHLREDIADEIADHLASHAEEDDLAGIEQPWVEAERAFGDPKQVARELRRVHLGDLIMFQRILAICMIVVAAATAVTAYFSWSSMTAMSERMVGATDSIAEVSEAMAGVSERMNAMSDETANQFKALNTQLQSMSDFERKTRPPSIRVFCYQGERDRPLADVSLHVQEVRETEGPQSGSSGELYVRTLPTNREGWMSTGPLEPGRYRVSYKLSQEEQTDEGSSISYWSAEIDLFAGDIGEMHVNLQPDHAQTFQFEIPRNVTWDRERMKGARILLVYDEAALQGAISGKWLNGRMSCSRKAEAPWDPFAAGELPTGDAHVTLQFGIPDQLKGQIPLDVPCGKYTVGKDKACINLQPASSDGWNVTGRVYMESGNQPLGRLAMDLGILHGPNTMSETLVTTSEGQFASLPRDAAMFKMPNVDQEASPRFTSPRILEWSEWPDSSTQRIFRHLVETACEMTDGGARCDLDMSDWHTLSIDVTGYRNQAPPMRATRSRRARDATSEETGIDLVPANLPVVLYWKREDEPAQETSEYRAVHRIALEGWHNLDTYQLYMHPGTYELRFEIPGIAPQVSDEIQMYVWKTSAMIDTHAKAQVVIDFHNLKCDRLPRPGRGSIQQRW